MGSPSGFSEAGFVYNHAMATHLALALGLLTWTLLDRDAAAQAGTAAGRISGRVFSMASGAIGEATVTLTRLDASAATPLTITSDRQGVFTFEQLPPGRYRLSASKSGYTNRQPIQPPADRFDTGRDLTLQAGGHAAHIELPLYRESSIAGRVAEPDGIPAPDVQVFAAVRRGTSHVVLQETRTLAEWDGRYRIANLPPGQYLVVVLPGVSTDPNRMRANAERRAPESSSATRPFFEPTFYPGETNLGSAENVTVFEGIPVDGIDTWLMPGERHSISGRITWPENTTAEHIVIEYANLTAQRSGLWTVPEPGDVFRISSVPRGTVVLLARADSNRGPLAGAITTEVNVDEIDDLELRLDTPGLVQGRIVYESSVPEANRAKTVVLKQRLLPVSPLYPAPESTVGADGVFRLTGALGVFDFLVGDLRIIRVTQHGREIPGGRIRVGSGETLTGLEVLVGQ
jgi:hypothetical protein